MSTASPVAPLICPLATDITLSPMLASTVPENLQILNDRSGLPALPGFSIDLHLSVTGASGITLELAGHIRNQPGSRIHRAA